MFLVDFFVLFIVILMTSFSWLMAVLPPFLLLGFCIYVIDRLYDKHLNNKKKKTSLFDDKL